MVESGNGNVQTDATSGTPVHTSNVMESPNSISSVDMNNQQVQQVQHQQYAQSASDGMNMQVVQQQQPLQQQQQQQQQQQSLMPQASPHGSTVMTAPSPAPSVSSSTNQGPPTGGGQGGQGGVHAPSLPSQSPHSQHNMTSPHPQPSPHQTTSPHPMTISPAAHSPYQQQQQQPQPQPSPQPSQGAQQQQQVPGSNPTGSGRQSVQPEQRSPHGQQLQYAQQHGHPAQMQHHLQQHMSRFYGHYPNYAAAAAMSQNPHHLSRIQAAGMASMFPPNPMFNLHASTTPPKQSSQSSRSVPGSNPQYTPTTTAAGHRSATSLARLQQLTNGLENTPGATGSGASVVTSGGNTSA